MQFSNLHDNTAVDMNFDTTETYDQELCYLGYLTPDSREALIANGSFLVITPEGPWILTPLEFYKKWKFYVPTNASRTQLRTIVTIDY